jgi:hypothetical protein
VKVNVKLKNCAGRNCFYFRFLQGFLFPDNYRKEDFEGAVSSYLQNDTEHQLKSSNGSFSACPVFKAIVPDFLSSFLNQLVILNVPVIVWIQFFYPLLHLFLLFLNPGFISWHRVVFQKMFNG